MGAPPRRRRAQHVLGCTADEAHAALEALSGVDAGRLDRCEVRAQLDALDALRAFRSAADIAAMAGRAWPDAQAVSREARALRRAAEEHGAAAGYVSSCY